MRFPHRSWNRRRPAVLAAVLAVVSGALTAALYVATPAQAVGCAAVIDRVTVSDVVIYAASPSRTVTTVTTHDPCTDSPYGQAGIFDVTGAAYLGNGDSLAIYYNNSTTPTWTGVSEALFDKYSTVGRATQSVEVLDADLNTTYRDGIGFYVRRNVVATAFNAGPEPVRKGTQLRVTGAFSRLSVSPLGAAGYVPYAGHQVDIYFRPLTSTAYTKVGSTLTTSTGTFVAPFTATVDGCWKALSTQTSYHVGRWVGADCVDVQ